jgi:hypothetical protein
MLNVVSMIERAHPSATTRWLISCRLTGGGRKARKNFILKRGTGEERWQRTLNAVGRSLIRAAS